jgi:protein-S-isoprenylcysteine O-methyltransferase Ste14
MTSTSSSGARSAVGQHASDQHASDKQVHHGRTPAAWAGSVIALIAFVVGGIGMVVPPHPNWIVVGIGVVLLVAGLIATVVLRKLGYGAD